MASPEEAIEYGEKTKKRYVHPRVLRFWFSLLYFGVVGMTFAIILGCWSPATAMFNVYGVDVHKTSSYLSHATAFNETQFQHPDLPDTWSFGFSGTCELYNDTSKPTKCYHAFPPLFSIEDLVHKALHNSADPTTNATLATWTAALASKPSNASFTALTKYNAHRKQSVSFFRGAAAAIVFSFVFALVNFVSSLSLISLATEEESKSMRSLRHWLYGAAVVDFAVYAGAVVCFGFGLYTGPGSFTEGAGMAEPSNLVEVGSIVLLVSLVCRIISIPVVGLVVLCIAGFELVLMLLVVYVMIKCFWYFLKRLDLDESL